MPKPSKGFTPFHFACTKEGVHHSYPQDQFLKLIWCCKIDGLRQTGLELTWTSWSWIVMALRQMAKPWKVGINCANATVLKGSSTSDVYSENT